MITSENVVLIEKNKKLRESHEEAVKKSSISYIKELDLKLDKKDRKILQLINMMRIATTEHISKIVYKDNKFADKLTQSKMRKLFSYGCVDKFAPRLPIGEGSPQNHYVLARPGAKIIKLQNFRPIRKLNQKWRHTVAVSDVFSGLACKYTIYEWQQEMKLNYTVGSKEYEIRPDCFAQWAVNDNDYYSFFEIDLGTETQDILNKKINAYHNYFYKSTEFMKAPWQPFDNPVILPIVFVLNDENRLKKMQNYYEKFKNKHSSEIQCHFTDFKTLI